MNEKSFLIRGGTIVTQNAKREVLSGELLIVGSKIKSIGKNIQAPSGAIPIDASGKFVIPGLVQAHTHLCQALFRGLADDMSLIDWLKKRIWPLESTHTEKSMQASAQIALLEMNLLGTTTILDMGSVRHTESLFEEVDRSGMRYVGGKCLMDIAKFSGPLYEETSLALKEQDALIRNWKNRNPLMQYALCPRFVVSCSDKILRACSEIQKSNELFVHIHASESKEEIALVKKRTGKNNIDFIDSIGLLNEKTIIVHGVHMTKSELKKMIRKKAGLVHCPSSNLKLASGVAPIDYYKNEGLQVGLGSDGAPCNNTMDPFMEMRLTALLQKPLFGPEALTAQTALDIATLGGARILGMDKKIGSLEVGKEADIVLVDHSHPSVATVQDPLSALVYSCSGRDVTDVFISGREIVRNREHKIYSRKDVLANAKAELKASLSRAKIAL